MHCFKCFISGFRNFWGIFCRTLNLLLKFALCAFLCIINLTSCMQLCFISFIQIQWFHNGRLVRPSKKYEMKLTKDGACSLKIKAVGPDDVGIYTCSATNVMGQEYSSAELYIADAKAVDETSYVSPEALRRMTYRLLVLIDVT